MKRLEQTNLSPISSLFCKSSVICYLDSRYIFCSGSFFSILPFTQQAKAQTKDSLVDLSKDNFCDDLKEKNINRRT
jgi:hypothetical protein